MAWSSPSRRSITLVSIGIALCTTCYQVEAQEQAGRIASSEEIRDTVRPPGITRVLSYPQRKVASGMEHGLVAFEQQRMRERFYQSMEDLRKRGIIPKFGGMGQGSGFGGGIIYEFRPAENHTLQTMALITFKNYQELGLEWNSRLPASRFYLEGSYQWRPQENYYGYGHVSSRAEHTSFALRQTWTGVRYEVLPAKRLRLGVLDRWAWITATQGHNGLFPEFTSFFPALPGYNRETRLNSTGAYLDIDGLREEYLLGGAMHLGGSYQRSFGGGNLRYFTVEMQVEGRTPIRTKNSVLVGQANFQLNRERGGSDDIPFYLQPHIGGSTSLRGYPLDRFYGRNVALLTLEYRIRVHPNIQFYPLFDEGQIFNDTSELSWLDWHRTYGFGFRFRSALATFLRLEFGWGGEGTQVHVVFGDRDQPPLLGAVRNGAYKR